MEAPRIIIRADASAAIGTGHVMRCIALAQAWRKRDGEVLFLHAEITPAVQARLESESLPSQVISATRGSADDAAQTLLLASSHGAAWIVADGYCFDVAWQRQIRAAGRRLLLVDDYAHQDGYEADVVLNQNAFATEKLYPGRPASTQVLAGASFAMVRPEFEHFQSSVRTAPPVAQRLLVTLGGGDPDNVTGRVIEALRSLPGMDATVVVGGSNPHATALQESARDLAPRVRVVVNATNMPELMTSADFAFAASGSTVWELAYLGVPSLVAVVADNQRGIAEEIDRRGFAENLGWQAKLTAARIADAIRALAADQSRRKEMSVRGRAVIDGHGAARVAAALGSKLMLTFVTDRDSWLNPHVEELKAGFERAGHGVTWIHEPGAMPRGDIAFLLSLGRIVPAPVLRHHAHNLVVHESALPHGRGWSPLTWQVIEGKNEIPVSLIEAVDAVDAGCIYDQETIKLNGTELVDELRAHQAAATLRLCRNFVARYPFSLSAARVQEGEPTYYPRRRPPDSQLDPDKTLRQQFNLLRVADPDRYPAFVEIGGRRFNVRITPA